MLSEQVLLVKLFKKQSAFLFFVFCYCCCLFVVFLLCLFSAMRMRKQNVVVAPFDSHHHLLSFSSSPLHLPPCFPPHYFTHTHTHRYINKSLTFLEQMVIALGAKENGTRDHVPYRSSKLTHLLKDCVGTCS